MNKEEGKVIVKIKKDAVAIIRKKLRDNGHLLSKARKSYLLRLMKLQGKTLAVNEQPSPWNTDLTTRVDGIITPLPESIIMQPKDILLDKIETIMKKDEE